MSTRYIRFFCVAIFFALICTSGLEAQASGASLKGMSFNGSTGLFSIPTGRIGWERSSNFGLDMGYHAIYSDTNVTHIPKVSMSLFNWLELNAAFDMQPDGFITPNNGGDSILGAKIQFPLTNTSLALGGNFQSLNVFNKNSTYRYHASQIYLAATYAGRFFEAPAETTVVVGKTFRENSNDTNIDFGMGFDMILLPRHLGGIFHWITDFSNFSYSVESFGSDAWYRGVINSGLRIDLSVIPPFRRFKFVVDLLITDALDSNRSFAAGAVFGVPF